MKFIVLFILAINIFFTPFVSNADLIIDVSGKNGIDASHGASSQFGGRHGKDAGYATSGTNAGNIDITLTEKNGVISIHGTHSGTFNTQSDPGLIFLRAMGGRGGNGGNGGHGGKGTTGDDGRDATRYSNGEDGDRGNRGGDGGNASSGADGKNGGQIIVRVREADIHTLYLLATPNVAGGQGGRAGKNGRGGKGGDGGQGGSPYRYTVHHSETCQRNVRDCVYVSKTCSRQNCYSSDGVEVCANETYECGSNECTTRIESYDCSWDERLTTPGGRDGDRGPRGRDGNANVKNGRSGRNGSFVYLVTYKNGKVKRYQRPFDIQLVSFEVKTQFEDQFIEPNENFIIKNITLKNTGGMPSPTQTKVYLGMLSSPHFDTQKSKQLVIPSLNPGQSITLDEKIHSAIVSSDLKTYQPGGRTVALGSSIVGINRSFSNFSFGKNLIVKYPVSIHRINGSSTISKGSGRLFEWNVQNIANRDLGTHSHSKRKIVIDSYVSIDGRKTNTASIDFYANEFNKTETSQTQSLAFAAAREDHSPKQSQYLRGRVSFNKNAKPFQNAQLIVTVKVQAPNDPHQMIEVDSRSFEISIGQDFTMTKGSDLLLITNSKTTQKEVKAWKKLGKAFMRPVDVWDIGVQGPLDLSANDSELSKHYQNGTIVILNNNTGSGEEVLTADSSFMNSPKTSLENAEEYGISVLVLDRSGTYDAVSYRSENSPVSDSKKSVIVASKLKDHQIHDPSYILSNQNFLNLSMALNFDQKVQYFIWLFDPERRTQPERQKAFKSISQAILQDLVIEQAFEKNTDEPWFSDITFVKETFPLLRSFLSTLWKKIPYVDGQSTATYEMTEMNAILEIISKMMVITNEMNQDEAYKILERFIFKLYRAQSGGTWVTSSEKPSQLAYDRLNEKISDQSAHFKIEIEELEQKLKDNDHSRIFKFPRKWAGKYYQNAMFQLILDPVYNRTYTSDFEIFDFVFENRITPPQN
tara:strand:+ start:716 stop:3652 length:2937 start_codon:yes stop_codon:yes gene_type:complete